MSLRVPALTASSKVIAYLCLIAAAVFGGYLHLGAHSIDYVGMSFTPSASADGGSGNWTITDAVAGGSNIDFSITYSINVNGNTTVYPKTVAFSAETTSKPSGAADAVVSGLVSHTFLGSTGAGSSFTDSVTITAPATPGAYSVKISGDPDNPPGSGGLGGGSGIVINFTVAEPSGPECQPASTQLSVADMCILLHRTEPVALSATLTSGGTGLAGKTVAFSIDGTPVGTAVTDGDGVATLSGVDASGLAVGDHDVVATYAGECDYQPSADTGNLGVQYMFIGYQQPINADGSSAFGGRTIPVKIKLADANGQPVIDAVAHVFFAKETPIIVGTDAEPLAMTNGDSGNLMRYDSAADQYIFNWDIAGRENGTYSIRVDLGEGQCGSQRIVVVSLKKKGSK